MKEHIRNTRETVEEDYRYSRFDELVDAARKGQFSLQEAFARYAGEFLVASESAQPPEDER